MALSKISSIVNSYNYITLMIDNYSEGEPKGRLYHESSKGTILFNGLIQMVLIIENIFSDTHYPMKSMDQRQFYMEEGNRHNMCYQIQPVDEPDRLKGDVGTVRIKVKCRYYATWQGEMFWLEKDEYHSFESFLGFVKLLDESFGKKRTVRMDADSRQLFKVAVDENEEMVMSDRLYQMLQFKQYKFNNVIELMHYIEYTLKEKTKDHNEDGRAGAKVKPIQLLDLQRIQGERATFIIRVLFEENSSWQGTVTYKNTGERVSFRSFLELILLMSNVLIDCKMYTQKTKQHSMVGRS